jgi:hypothetical protein
LTGCHQRGQKFVHGDFVQASSIGKVNCIGLREDSSVKVFQNRMLNGVFEPKREEVTGKWRN